MKFKIIILISGFKLGGCGFGENGRHKDINKGTKSGHNNQNSVKRIGFQGIQTIHKDVLFQLTTASISGF